MVVKEVCVELHVDRFAVDQFVLKREGVLPVLHVDRKVQVVSDEILVILYR